MSFYSPLLLARTRNSYSLRAKLKRKTGNVHFITQKVLQSHKSAHNFRELTGKVSLFLEKTFCRLPEKMFLCPSENISKRQVRNTILKTTKKT